MELIPIDTPEAEALMRKLAKERGRTGEHNPDWFLTITRGEGRVPYVTALDDRRAALVFDSGAKWDIQEDPLAATEELARTAIDVASALLVQKPEAKKVAVELKTDAYQELLGIVPSSLHVKDTDYTLDWPIHDLEQFDGALPGKLWKNLRNARNAFEREHSVQTADAREIDKETLHTLVRGWSARRPQHADDPTFEGRYHAMIEGGFAGFGSARAILVDGKVAGINGGWPYPGKEGCWYGAVGLHDYAFKDIGEMLYLEDLVWAKAQGWKFANMGGTDGGASAFKKQFHPTSWYQTHAFSIVRA